MTTSEAIITKILNCGTSDISLLDRIDYDTDDIIDELIANDNLSLNSILGEVLYMGVRELQEKFDENKEDIISTIVDKLAEEKIEYVDSGEMTEEELEQCDEHKELVRHLQLIESNSLCPTSGCEVYLNYQDTHVYIKNLDFYHEYMETEVDEIESKMGWSFEDMGD